jgi:exodeoxyribonuclease VII large subunit
MHCRERLIKAMVHNLERNRRFWLQKHEQLQALGPANVLSRGYAIVKDAQGNILRDVKQVKIGDDLIAVLSSGRLRLRVESIEEPDNPDRAPPQ